jgi:Family of unknown function (DUF6174)
MRGLCFAVVVLWTAACSDSVGPSDVKEFDRVAFLEARARWQSAGITNYTVESRQACFCPPHLHSWTRLTVRANSIAAADPVEPLPSGITSQLAGWRTVPELFAFIESVASSSNHMATKIAVTYDVPLGFPRDVSIECRPNIADCDADFSMRSLTLTQ